MEGGASQWLKAQEISFSVDLLGAAKQQLRFLAAVDRTGCLYDGPALDRAIYRYKNCWLPLLAKHLGSSVLDGPLVVPFDCEWVWHCHRLNPLQYKRDCEELYGRILETSNVKSTVEGACSKESESVWNNIYVTEPYNLDLGNNAELPVNVSGDDEEASAKSITYDLVEASKRQSSFFGKVWKDIKGRDVDEYLEEAVGRYKAFLYMAKTVRENKTEFYCVPTRDIDLIWHTHQLYPTAYCKDHKASVGMIMDHNDRDIGTEEGEKMAENWLSKTTQQWQDTFGNMYAGSGVIAPKGVCTEHARCWCLMAADSDQAKKQEAAARCWCLMAANSDEVNKAATTKQEAGARCWCLVGAAAHEQGNMVAPTKQEAAARCWCLVGAAADEQGNKGAVETARCWCLVGAADEGNKAATAATKQEAAARCWCLVGAANEGNIAAVATKQEAAARCWCLVGAAADEQGNKAAVATKQEAGARCWCLVGAADELGNKDAPTKQQARCWCLMSSEVGAIAQGISVQ